ncbi:MAG: acyl-CoA dehydrogenase family protein [Chloroflexota bacterium]|nr:acyl-CoA dehydrogenase family protein [Chloroflexota bacterium]
MISFTPTDEQQQLIDVIRRFAVDDLQPAAHAADEGERVPTNLAQTGWAIGLVPTLIPEELGGLGELSAVTNALAYEELAYGDLSTALHILSPSLFAAPITLYGTAAQREQYLPLFLDEIAPPFSAALLEPGIAFNAGALRTTARADGDSIVLDGEKAYVPLAASAKTLLVYARDSATGDTGAYIVETDAPGVTVGAREALMGIRALHTARLTLNGVRVGADCKVGGAVGIDYPALLARSRTALAALAVGVARQAFEYARDYAKGRVQFGSPIAQKQAIAFMLAEMAIEVDAARLLVWEAAWTLDQGRDATRQAYLAREYADKASLFVTDCAVQVLGGYGFIREYPVERLLRNARGFTTFDGLAIV